MLRRSIAVLSSAFALAIAQEGQDPKAGAGITWHQDFAASRALAKQTGKPLLVTFRCER